MRSNSTKSSICFRSVVDLLQIFVDLLRNKLSTDTQRVTHRRCPHSMRSSVCAAADCPSVRQSVCLSRRSTAAVAACGGFAAERRAGRRYRLIVGTPVRAASCREPRLSTDGVVAVGVWWVAVQRIARSDCAALTSASATADSAHTASAAWATSSSTARAASVSPAASLLIYLFIYLLD